MPLPHPSPSPRWLQFRPGWSPPQIHGPLVFLLLWGSLLAQTPGEQVVDDFEGVKATWQVVPSDSLQEIVPPRRTDRSALLGHRCEFVAAVGRRGGDTIYLRHPLPPSAVIDEFAARLWVRGDRAGYQLLVRVRLPRTLDEAGEPVSMLLAGDQYVSPGQWQQLTVDALQPKLARMTRVLRAGREAPVDPAEAFVDMLLLNIYGGAGLNRVWIDNLSLQGAVPRPPQRTQPTAIQLAAATARLPTTQVTMRDGHLAINGQPFVPRGVTYRGESLATLRQLGFNTVWLNELPTPALEEEAARHDVWFVCPPPSSPHRDLRGDRVIAWCIDAWKATHPKDTEQLIGALRKQQPLRPLAIVSRSGESAAIKGADIAIESALCSGMGSGQVPVWKVLGEPLGEWSRWMLLRQDALEALARGCQGFLLQTGSGLEVGGPSHPRRLAELLNLELTMARPWTGVARVHRSEDGAYRVALLANEHSALAIVRQDAAQQTPMADIARPIEITDYARRDVFLIEPGGLSPVRHHRAPGGIRLALPKSRPHAKLLLTDRAGVIQQVNRHLREIGMRVNELLIQSARQELLDLDRRIEHSSASSVFKADLREDLHNLQSHFTPLLESPHQSVTYRQLEEMFWRLEQLQRRL